MIRHAINRAGRAIEIPGRAAPVGKSGLPQLEVAKEGKAFLSRENQVNIHCRQRLGMRSPRSLVEKGNPNPPRVGLATTKLQRFCSFSGNRQV
jgi:hypothetical protein